MSDKTRQKLIEKILQMIGAGVKISIKEYKSLFADKDRKPIGMKKLNALYNKVLSEYRNINKK